MKKNLFVRPFMKLFWFLFLQNYIMSLKSALINPFAPEPPVTARADPGPFYPLWRH